MNLSSVFTVDQEKRILNLLEILSQVDTLQERFETLLSDKPASPISNSVAQKQDSKNISVTSRTTTTDLKTSEVPKTTQTSTELITRFAFRILNGKIDINELLSLIYPDIIALFGPEIVLITQDIISSFAPSAIPSGKYTLDFITNAAVNQILDLAGFVLNSKISDLFDLKTTLSNLIKPIFKS